MSHTARALTYMILLKAGYDFFRYVPISGILSEERSQYYKVLKASQDKENGYDFTYFTDYHTDLLARTAAKVSNRLEAAEKYEKLKNEIGYQDNERLLKGAEWIISDSIKKITVAEWRRKFGISVETARKDLLELVKAGFLDKKMIGHKMYFEVK